jgi:hypothetical protein
MAVSDISGSGSFGNTPSAYGNTNWGLSSFTSVGASLPPGAGTAWAVWQIGIAGLTPNQPVNGITISGPISFYVSCPVARTARLYVAMYHSFPEFNSSAGDALVITVPGDQKTYNVNYQFTKQGFTTNDLANGTLYLGFAVSTTAEHPECGNSSYSLGALDWTIYTGPNYAVPPSGSPTGKLTNPASNVNPGVFPGGQLLQATMQLLTPLPQQYYTCTISVPYQSGLTFVDTGTYSMRRNMGYQNFPNDPYRTYSTPINVAANTKPGTYVLTGYIAGLSQSEPTSLTMTSQLRVRPRGSNLMLTET